MDIFKIWRTKNSKKIKWPKVRTFTEIFKESDIFDENFNCGIIGFIRDLCEKHEEDGRITHARHEDTNYVMLYVHDIQLNPNEEENNFDILYVTWYKSRGETDEMWLLGYDLIPVKPTFSQLISIIEYYKR